MERLEKSKIKPSSKIYKTGFLNNFISSDSDVILMDLATFAL